MSGLYTLTQEEYNKLKAKTDILNRIEEMGVVTVYDDKHWSTNYNTLKDKLEAIKTYLQTPARSSDSSLKICIGVLSILEDEALKSTRRDTDMIDELYKTLRVLVSNKFSIRITDGRKPTIALVPDGRESHPWTSFEGVDIEDAFNRTINKLRHPEKDYRAKPDILNEEGHLWKADESSIYSEAHTRRFLINQDHNSGGKQT